MSTLTEPKTRILPPWKLAEIFAPAASSHVCCECCDGYCPATDLPMTSYERPDLLFAISGRWISDQYVAIDSSMIQLPEDLGLTGNVEEHGLSDTATWTGIESTAQFSAGIAVLLLDLGILIQEEPGTTKSGNRLPQSLWYSQESAKPVHVGWIMPAHAARYVPPTLDTVRRYQRILSAREAHPNLRDLIDLINMEPYRALSALESTFGAGSLDGAK